jgi:hypothetical protein
METPVAALFEHINFLNSIDLEEAMKADPSGLMDKFHNNIQEMAEEVANQPIKHCPDWFTESEASLLNCIMERNQAFKTHTK